MSAISQLLLPNFDRTLNIGVCDQQQKQQQQQFVSIAVTDRMLTKL